MPWTNADRRLFRSLNQCSAIDVDIDPFSVSLPVSRRPLTRAQNFHTKTWESMNMIDFWEADVQLAYENGVLQSYKVSVN